MKNRITDLFGIKYPILQGGMLWIADAELAAAVSDAGGLGTLSPYAGMKEGGDALANLRRQILETRQRTAKPFAVNIPLDLPDAPLLLPLLLEEQVAIAVISAGSPEIYTDLLHSGGIKVAHVVGSTAQARRAEQCGVDAVIAVGAEAGGRIGRAELTLFSLIPQIVNAVSVPVIAAGGIADARGMAAAFALGAQGVQMGTRFIAVKECPAHPEYKKAILAAGGEDTIVAGRALIPARRIRNRFSEDLAALEQSGATIEALREFTGRGRARRAQLEGDIENGDLLAGSSVGLIRSITTAAEVVESLVCAALPGGCLSQK